MNSQLRRLKGRSVNSTRPRWETCRAHPAMPEKPGKTAGQSPFAAGSRIASTQHATSSERCLPGRVTEKPRSDTHSSARHPAWGPGASNERHRQSMNRPPKCPRGPATGAVPHDSREPSPRPAQRSEERARCSHFSPRQRRRPAPVVRCQDGTEPRHRQAERVTAEGRYYLKHGKHARRVQAEKERLEGDSAQAALAPAGLNWSPDCSRQRGRSRFLILRRGPGGGGGPPIRNRQATSALLPPQAEVDGEMRERGAGSRILRCVVGLRTACLFRKVRSPDLRRR